MPFIKFNNYLEYERRMDQFGPDLLEQVAVKFEFEIKTENYPVLDMKEKVELVRKFDLVVELEVG